MDGLKGQFGDIEALPPHTSFRSAIKRALPVLAPAEEISVVDAAMRNMRVRVGDQWRDFDPDVAPYMNEPMNTIASRDYRAMVFAGPSRCGKTQMLQSAIAYTIACDPGRIALYQMTRESAAEFEREQIAPMIANSPELAKRREKGRGADNLYQKLFVGGTHLTLDFPTLSKMKSRTIRTVLATELDDYVDQMDPNAAWTHMRARTQTLKSRGMTVAESSPFAPITDENWAPKTIHDCPPVRYGVLAIYPQGTRGRWYWPCPDCGTYFEPSFHRLVYPKSDDPKEMGEAARMRCPHCEGTFEHALKRELNVAGIWQHESADNRAVTLASGDARETDTLSYWLNGAAAAFSTWSELVQQWEAAEAQFARTGDEGALMTAAQTGHGMPYLPRAAVSGGEVALHELRDKSVGNATPKGVAPAWTRYVTVSVDTQKTYFSVGVTAWGENGRHQPVDRFDLTVPPEGAPGGQDRTLKPFDIAEDWRVLEALTFRTWPVEGQTYALRPVALVVDQQGIGAATDNAYAFFRQRRAAGQAGRVGPWFISRGRPGLQLPDRVWLKAPETAQGKRRVARDVLILNMAVDRLKDAVVASLRLEEIGQNHTGIPEWMTEQWLLEFTAERRGERGWGKRPGMKRNESLDHLVQARAVMIQLGAERIDWAAPPAWALGGSANAMAQADAPSDDAPAPSGAAPENTNDARASRRAARSSQRKGWFRS